MQEPSAAGSPVLWTDGANGSYVVGVIKCSNEILLPHMFTASSLQLPGKNISGCLFCLLEIFIRLKSMR